MGDETNKSKLKSETKEHEQIPKNKKMEVNEKNNQIKLSKHSCENISGNKLLAL